MIEAAGAGPRLRWPVAAAAVAAVAIAVASALNPTATVFAVAMGTGAVILRRHPLVLVVGYAVVEPLQDLLLRVLPAPTRYLDEAILVGLFLAVVGPRLVRRPARVLRDPYVALIALFAIEGLASAWVNRVPAEVALAGLFVTLDYVLLFLVLRALRPGPREARALIYTLGALGVVATVVALLQHLFPGLVAGWQLDIREGGLARVPSLFRHPNAFGYFMLSATFVTLSAAMTTRRIGLWIIAGVCALGVLVSVSRSSYLALFLSVGVVGVMFNRRLLKVWLVLAVVATTVLAPVVVGGVEARIAKVRREGGDARLTYLVESLPILRAHPLLGVGPGRFGGQVAHFFGTPVDARYRVRFRGSWTTVDDFWLHLTVESGVVGLLLVVWILWRLFADAARRLRGPPGDPWVRALLLATVMLVVAFAVVDAMSMALEANETAGLFWLVCGLALAGAGDALGGAEGPAPVVPPGG